MMQRFADADIPRYVAAIESSTSYYQAIVKIGGKHHDYAVIKRIAKQTGAKLQKKEVSNVVA
jgi:hypothetical protein